MLSPFVSDGTLTVEDVLKLAEEKVTPAGGAPPFVASAVADAFRAGKVPRAKLQFLRWGLFAGLKPSRFVMAADALGLPAGPGDEFGLRAIGEVELVAGRKDADPGAVLTALHAVRPELRADACFSRLAASAIVVGVQLKHIRDPAAMEESLTRMGPALKLLAEGGRVHSLAMLHGVVSFWLARGNNFIKREETLVFAVKGLLSAEALTPEILRAWTSSSLPAEAGIETGRGDAEALVRTRVLS
jgi:hypothetical protein